MAKVQNLTLNSLKISGPCGRLLCCLAYEYDTYRELKKELPAEGSRVQIGSEKYKIVDVNIFTEYIRIEGATGKALEINFEYFYLEPNTQKWQVREGFDAVPEDN
jgi:cell fate regulator YaaT (PSP1 superfamily)